MAEMKHSAASTRGVVVLAIIAAAGVTMMWFGCGSDEASGGGGLAGTAGAAAGSGSGGVAGTAASGGAGTGGSPIDGGIPCPWPGWYVAPRMPPGCDGLCIAPDPAAVLPEFNWSPRSDICAGCLGLETPWAAPDAGALPLVPGVSGVGPGVRVYGFGLLNFEGSDIGVYMGETGKPIAAWRRNASEDCGRRSGVVFSHDGLAALNLRTIPGSDQHFVARPIEQLHELMDTTDTTLVWPGSFVGSIPPGPIWFSSELVAGFFTGRMAIGHFATGKTVWVDTLPGALPGQYSGAQVVGGAVLVSRYDFSTNDWWIYQGGELSPYLGAPDRNIFDLVTDGGVMVWIDASQPFINDGGGKEFTRWDVYKAPFTTDPAKLAPQLLVPDVPPGIYWMQLQNGYASGVYYRDASLPATPTDAFVVRVADGWAAKSELPKPYSWGSITFPGPTELWGGARVTDKAETLIRVPYTSMQVIQTATPAGAGSE
jgi:hypothetical protein